jgi:hypothetical protein
MIASESVTLRQLVFGDIVALGKPSSSARDDS